MGNKLQKMKSNKNSQHLPHNPSFISVNGSFSQASLSIVSPMSPSTIHPLSFPNIFNDEQLPAEIPKSVSISSRTSFSTHKGTSTVHTKTDPGLNINNGVTGKYLSCRIAKIASDFWKEYIEPMSVSDKLEIGCAIYFGMFSANKEIKTIMKCNIKQENDLKSTSIKYLEMMGWLTKKLLCDDIDLYLSLTKLGTMHKNMGINLKHFNPMLEAMHDVFSYYFPNKYSIQVKYAVDEIFTLAAQIMTAQNIKCCSHLNEIAESFAHDIAFLKNLDICLKSSVGRKYLYRYLRQTWCEELAIFLQSLHRFKNQTCVKERFMVARNIGKISIQPFSNLSINISYQCRQNIFSEMRKLEKRFAAKQELFISSDFFDQCEYEVKKLIMVNHWTEFVNNIQKLQLNSLECNQ